MTLVEKNGLEFVREIILNSKESIQDWAYNLNVSRQTVYDWLNKDVKIRKKNVYQVAQLSKKEIVIVGNNVKFESEQLELTNTVNEREGEVLSIQAEKIINNQNMTIDMLQEKLDLMEQKLNLNNQESVAIENQIDEFCIQAEKDIEFKNISQSLDNIQKSWDKIFYASSQPMSVSQDGIIKNVNKTFYKGLGYSQDEMVGRTILEFIHPDEHKKAIKEISSGEADQIHRVLKKNGNYCKVKINASSFGGVTSDNSIYSVALMEALDDYKDID